jgi:CheY-like chemotaxis protein
MEAFGRLAGGVAHDFNNLLTVITGFAGMAKATLGVEHPVRNALHDIEEAAKRAGDLTHQLLAFARKQVVAPQAFDANERILQLQKLLRRLISEDIDLVTRLDPSVGLVRIDPGHFEQVVVNLAVNARDAITEGGAIFIETANVRVDAETAHRHSGVRPGEYVLLAVRDTGCGMSKELVARIFEPFFTTKEPGKGTGLGLSTCYGIITQNAGHISVESSPGEGTTFYVYLPAVRETATVSKESAEEPPLPEATGTVLLVEDEPMVRRLAARVLRSRGYVVIEAENGADALRLARMHDGSAIDLLLTDVVMPRMSGHELAARVKPTWPEMRVLYMSGHVDEDFIRRGAFTSGDAFLQKPFNPDLLVRRVRAVLTKDSSSHRSSVDASRR